MNINFDVIINSEDYSVDMPSGLETLRGASEASRQIATTILEERVPERLSSDGKIRTKLKKSFRGSYGQEFSIEIHDASIHKRFRKIGKEVFVQLISYFISEALYQESIDLSEKARKVLDDLGDNLEQRLISQLQKSSLNHLHAVSNNFNQDVELRYRKNREKQITLAKLNQKTYEKLLPVENRSTVCIFASITRLNINTGNGRLLIHGESETIAFGFPTDKHFHDLKTEARQVFSENLHINNGKPREEWKLLKISAYTKRTKSDVIIKYIIEDFVKC